MAGAWRGGVAVLTALVAFLLAPSATAATRYAEPPTSAPHSPGDTCPDFDPCSIGQAIQNAAVANGDTVLLLPGTYPTPDGSAIVVGKGITVAAAGPTRPTITNGSGVFVVNHSGAVLRDLNIEASNLPSGIADGARRAVDLTAGAMGERLYIDAGGTSNPHGVLLSNGAALRDSVAWSSGPGAVGVVTAGSGAGLRNVTAVGDAGAGAGAGVFVRGSGADQTTTLRNTVASGSTDVTVTQGAVGTVTFAADHSNYDTQFFETGSDVSESSIQTAAPIFADVASGNFHQLAASPTIDAGSADGLAPALGPQDLDGQARVQGSAPDIGADEFVPASTLPPGDSPSPPEGSAPPPAGGSTTDSQPPETTITKEPPDRTTKQVARFKFVSSEPNSTFRCKRDGKPYKPCTSPRRYGNLEEAKHRFKVGAVDPTGNVDPTPDKDTWKVVD